MERRNYLYRTMRDEIGKCELCGSKRDLEMHHIVPLSLIEDNPYADTQENLLCVCGKCHALLTPRKVLTSIGVRKAINRNSNQKVIEFYKKLNEITGNGDALTVEEILNIFDTIFIDKKQGDI